MKRIATTAAAIIFVTAALCAGADDDRTLATQVDGSTLVTVQLESGVGDIDILGSGGTEVRAEVVLSPRRGGFFSSLKTSRRQIAAAELKSEIRGDVLELEIDSDAKERRFEERWTVILPSHLKVNLELGVGDVRITDLRAGIDLEVGVGEVDVKLEGGSIEAEVGVGGITIHAPSAIYGSVEGAAGVGDVLIDANGRKITGEGFIGHAAEWQGDGDAFIEAEAGVGDVQVFLE